MRPPQRSYRAIAPVLFGLQAFLLVSCESSSALDPLSADGLAANAQRNGHRASSIELSVPDSSLTAGQEVQATAVVIDKRGHVVRNATVTWATASHDVANVSSTGVVTGGTAMGTTTISATAGDARGTMTLASVGEAAAEDTTEGDTLMAVPDSASALLLGVAGHMTSITANATTLKIGQTTQVSGVVRDINGTPISGVPITWSTSPTTVATVVSTSATSGVVTAKGVG